MRIKKTFQTTVPTGKVLNNYTESNVDTYSCDYINGLETYSTDEVRIGTWMNKPLYRKIVEINGLPNNASASYNTNIVNGSLCKYNAYGKLTGSDTNILIYPYISPYASSGNVTLNVSSDASKVNITTQTDRSSASALIIIEYTKTTD